MKKNILANENGKMVSRYVEMDADEIAEMKGDEQNAVMLNQMTLEERMKVLETRAMEQDEALMELAGMLAETETGEN